MMNKSLSNVAATHALTSSLLLMASLSLGCGLTADDVPGQCPHNLSGELTSSFGNAELDALLEATGKFSATTAEIEATMRTACNAIATDLGAATSTDTATACSNASQAISAVLDANAEATLVVEYLAPRCNASLDAMVECAADCDVAFDASATPPTCSGGDLSGACAGECSGSCTVEAAGECAGSCDATCEGACNGSVSGTCSGTCTGQCSGTCSVLDNDGNCAGVCTGTCSGTCSGVIEGSCAGTCAGSCSGSCRFEGSGECSGTCSGSCDVAFEAPSCEGGTVDVDASADCQAACESNVAFDVECSEPAVIVSFSGAVNTDLEPLAATLTANYGAILAVISRLELVVGVTAELVSKVADAAGVAATIGLDAADCIRLAGQAQIAAAASLNVSVTASASVSGSISSN